MASFKPCLRHKTPIRTCSSAVQMSFQRECCLSEIQRRPMVPGSSRTPCLSPQPTPLLGRALQADLAAELTIRRADDTNTVDIQEVNRLRHTHTQHTSHGLAKAQDTTVHTLAIFCPFQLHSTEYKVVTLTWVSSC